MRKNGFTLAEVLITLGIIGTIAALTFPALHSNTSDQVNVARLSTEISNLENAFATMLIQEDEDSLENTNFGGGFEANSISQYLKVSGTYDNLESAGYSSDQPFRTLGGESLELPGVTRVATLKDGGVAIFNHSQDLEHSEDRLSSGSSTGVKAGEVYIDVNGPSQPNRAGRDLFAFVLGGDGVLYPYGSQTASLLLDTNGKASNNTFENSSAACTYRCTDTGGFGCTAKLIQDGYKIKY